nr:carbonic anhydrase [Caldovatus aquaticus]
MRGKQRPEATVIARAGSRTDPAVVTGAAPGDLRVVRDAAAPVPPCEEDRHPRGMAAAIGLGIAGLGVRCATALGHSFCAGVRCLPGHDHVARRFAFVSDRIEVAAAVCAERKDPATEAGRALAAGFAERATVLASPHRRATSPFVSERVAGGRPDLHGWPFRFGWGVPLAASGRREEAAAASLAV